MIAIEASCRQCCGQVVALAGPSAEPRLPCNELQADLSMGHCSGIPIEGGKPNIRLGGFDILKSQGAAVAPLVTPPEVETDERVY